MEKIIKTENIAKVYPLLNAAKLTKMDDADKLKAIKALRVLKPVANVFEEASKDAAEKLKPEGLDERLQAGQEFERAKREGGETKMTEAEYKALVKELGDYNRLVSEAAQDLADKDVTIDIEPLSEDAFAKLVGSNDWTAQQSIEIGDLIATM